MQDRYAGDVGDFGKYGLLRALQASLGLPLGVVWYRYPNEDHNEDGKFTQYLDSEQSPYRSCEPELWKQLRKLVRANRRSVAAIQSSKVMGGQTQFFDRFVDCYEDHPKQTKAAKDTRSAYRQQWLDDALASVRDARLVFLDPDNGLEVKSCSKTHLRKAGKFAFYFEAEQFFREADVLVVYHHLNYNSSHGSHANQLQERSKELKSRLKCDAVFGLRYRPFSARAFFVACRGPFVTSVESTLAGFLDSGWRNFWDAKFSKA